MLEVAISGHDVRQPDWETPAQRTGATREACTALSDVLRTGTDINRTLAARALGWLAEPESCDALVDALRDEDEDVRSEAAAALARIRPAGAASQLKENLVGDPCAQVKLHAIDALTAMRETEIVPLLRRLVRHRDPDIAWDDDEFYQSGWDDWLDVQVKAVESLASLGADDAVPDIVAAMHDGENQDLSDVGFTALVRLGEAGIEALARFLDDPSVRRRRRAAAILAMSDQAAAGQAAERALSDASSEVRLAAATGLARRDPANERILPAFADPDAEIRAAMVRLAGRQHPNVIAESLDDTSEVVRQAALELIAADPEGLPRDITENVQAFIGSDVPKSAALAAQAYASVAGEGAFEELDAVLRAKDRPETVRLGALDGIRMIGGAAAVLALASVLDDEARQLRLRAMAALAHLAANDTWPNSAGDVLLAALGGELIEPPETDDEGKEQEQPRAQSSERSAGEPSEPGTGSDGSADESSAENQTPVSTLDAILGAESPAADVLRRRSETTGLTPTDLDYLARAQERAVRKRVVSVLPPVAPHQDVRRLAARMLGDIPELDVFRAVVAALEDRDDEVAGHAADSLARIAPPLGHVEAADADALVHAIAITPERSRKLNLIRALGHLGRADCAGTLGRYLKDKDRFIRLEAARALGHLAAPAPGLEARLKDSDPGVRMAAAEAIAVIEGRDAFDRLFDLVFAFGGEHRRGAAGLLRQINVAAASEGFNSILRDRERMRAWPSAIEALEELHGRVEGADA